MQFATSVEGNRIVERDIKRIKSVKGKCRSLVLFGAFGKGEGLVINGKPSNDYDLLVIDASDKYLKNLSELEIDTYLDIHAISSKALSEVSCTQFWYEIKYASYLIKGKELGLPDWNPWDIPYRDALESINKRCTSMILGKYEMGKDNPEMRKVIEQIDKGIIALGDATLIKRGQFHPSYAIRSLLLSEDEISGLYQLAAATKLTGFPDLTQDQIWQMWHRTRELIREYVLLNDVRVLNADVLFSITDTTTQEELKEVLIKLGAESWL